MKKTVALVTLFIVMFGILVSGQAEVTGFPGQPVVGIAWRADTDSEFSPTFAKPWKPQAAHGSCWIRSDRRICHMMPKAD